MKKFIIDSAAQGKKVQEFLKEQQNFSSRSMRKIKIKINEKPVKSMNTRLYRGDVLEVNEVSKESNLTPKKLALDIVYEDDDLLIVNKPPYLLVHPTQKKADITLAEGVYHYFLEKGETCIPRFYNRIDMNTSGLVVITKNAFSQSFLQKNSVKKYYQALVSGIPSETEFIVEEPIFQEVDNLKRIIDSRGQYAKTAFKCIRSNENLKISLLEAELFTGRTHQIRVHLASLGLPILGDTLYGASHVFFKRQLLHSYKIIFTHPTTHEEINLTIDLPRDMKIL